MLVADTIMSMFIGTPNFCSNSRQIFMCSDESHANVLSMDESGPSSSSGMSSVLAMKLTAA
jgi:hypothetical protein